MGTNVLELSKKKKQREQAEEKERMRAASVGTFLNEGEKENKRRGDRDRTTCVEEKKKPYGWNEMRERRNNIKNKKSWLRNITIIFSQ